ncbi:hypothetical protein ACS127_12805 [Amphibacillus sp. Q70]|uniref:hypothetical protein n=1 Tax=Amphibacillus sp. Q70 TaxID=3453416 RepID=UPI003F8547DF
MKHRMLIIEWMGIIGLLFWAVVVLLRKMELFDTSSLNALSLIIWTAPNFGGAWFSTAWLKQFIAPAFTAKSLIKISFTKKVYFYVCLVIFAIGFILEIINPYLLGGTTGFDIYDMIATAIAELLIFILPVWLVPELFESKR